MKVGVILELYLKFRSYTIETADDDDGCFREPTTMNRLSYKTTDVL